MNKSIKARWIAALRSGRFRKARGAMQKDSVDGQPTFCAMGVLAEVLLEDGEFPELHRVGRGYAYNGEGRVTAGFEQPMLDRLGLSHQAQSDVISMNDGGHRTFNEIADAIEASDEF